MKIRTGTLIAVLSLSIVLGTFHRWFMPGALGASDFIQVSSERLGNFKWLPGAWSTVAGNGFGGSTFPQLNLDLYVHFFIRLFVFGLAIPWSWTQKIIFFWPFLIVGALSSYYFVFGILKRPLFAVIGALVYLTNTYILMIAGGGQVGLMMAYAVAPLVFSSFLRNNLFLFVVSSVFFIMFDIRYAYLIYASLVLYVFVMVHPKDWLTVAKQFFPAMIFIVAAHLYWIIPLITSPSYGLPAGYGDSSWLAYLSWADFSKTVSLLHPNWPENIFGKTYFMKSEFLLLPLLSFLPFISLKLKDGGKVFRFFSSLLLLGSFLAKGVNPPFGEIYEWLFVHVPLFNVFRDPTKFYLIIALSYAVTIPYALSWIDDALLRNFKRTVGSMIFPVLFLILWSAYLIPVWKGELRGTFTSVEIASDYKSFEHRVSGGEFSRILAVPWRHRFLFESELHPVVNSSELFGSSDMERIVEGIIDPSFEHTIRRSGIRYIVVPYDKEGEVFLTDRHYNDALRQSYISALSSLPYLSRLKEFSDLVVFEYSKPAGHFYRELKNLDLENQPDVMIRPSRYIVTVKTQERPTNIIFSETFDPGWVLWDGTKDIHSVRTAEGWNSFRLDTNDTSKIEIFNTKEHLLTRSYGASALTLCVLVLLYICRKNGKHVIWLGAGIVFIGGAICARSLNAQQNNGVGLPEIWRSAEWKLVSGLHHSSNQLSARFGGSTLQFMLRDATFIDMHVEGDNPIPSEQSLDITIDDIRHTLVSPFEPKSRMKISNKKIHSGVPVSIVLHCSSAMIPCNVRISSLSTDGTLERWKTDEQRLPTVAIFGDSISTSFGKDNYGYMLAKRMGYRLHNASVFGSSVVSVPGWDAASMRVYTDIIEFHPDVALIVLGTNDLGRQIPIQTFESAYDLMIAEIQSKSPETKVVAVGLFPRKDFSIQKIRSYSDAIERVAHKRNILFINPRDILTVSDLSDPVHPTQESQQKIADGLYARLQTANRAGD